MKQNLKVCHLSEGMHIYLLSRSSSILNYSKREMINQTERKGCFREIWQGILEKLFSIP